jgi:hypothetical protein
MSTDAAANATGLPTLAGLARRALRDFGREQAIGAALLGAVVSTVNMASFVVPLRIYALAVPITPLLAGWFVDDQIKAFVLVAAIVIADRAVDEGASRRRAYFLAALCGCVAGVAVVAPLDAAWRTWMVPDTWPTARLWQHGRAAYVFYPLFDLTHWLLIGSAVVFLHADRRAARGTAARLQAAERDRIRRGRVALETRLQAMQARIEPRFLFNTLSQVERLFAIEPARAASMLEHLIAYLRAAMPQMRDTSSTVANEIDLVRAWLDIARLGPDGPIAVAIDVTRAARGVRMPAMMLLPLIDRGGGPGTMPRRADASMRITAAVDARRLAIEIVDDGAGLVIEPDGDAAAPIRERLATLYGEDATLAIARTGARATLALLDLPLEASPGSPGGRE